MDVYLFGASTPCGEGLRELKSSLPAEWRFILCSRHLDDISYRICRVNLTDPSTFTPYFDSVPKKSVWISFAPIWLLAPFLDKLAKNHSERLEGICGIIACSSSSAITKRFAWNRFDRHLAARLISSEDQLLSTCRGLALPCCILRPTLIYGQVGIYSDRNLSLVLNQLRRLPLLLLPADTGLRQPIHATQLAASALHLAQQLVLDKRDSSLSDRISIGGDITMTYLELIIAIQNSLPASDAARNCRLLSIPNRLFFLLASPLILVSPKAFEAVLRMSANLAGFTPAHHILGTEPQTFPVTSLD